MASAANAAAIEYPPNTSGTNIITHVGIGTASSGAGVLLFFKALGSSITTTPSSNAIIRFAIGALTVALTGDAATAFLQAQLSHIFNNADIANIGDASGLQNSATNGNLYISLHTADPTATGNQTSSEATFTGYARQAVDRAGSAWTVT